MIHKAISISRPINSLSEFAQLLFTWIIPHLDDFGKIDGNAEVIRALVIPMNRIRSEKDVEDAILEIIKKVPTVIRYEVEKQSVLHFTSFDEHQVGLEKRTKSKYPDNILSEKFSETQLISEPIEESRSEMNRIKIKRNKLNKQKKIEEAYVSAWEKLGDPKNPTTLDTVFFKMKESGLPDRMFFKYTKSILQKNVAVKDRVMEFEKLAKSFFKKKKS